MKWEKVGDGEEVGKPQARLFYGPPQSRWEIAVAGMRRFCVEGWADKAALAGWTADELYRVPPLWSRIDLAGAALLIGADKVIEVTEKYIAIETATGSRLRLRRAEREHVA
jgi:hypothetical protein